MRDIKVRIKGVRMGSPYSDHPDTWTKLLLEDGSRVLGDSEMLLSCSSTCLMSCHPPHLQTTIRHSTSQ